jgi:hypothetical protein
MAWRSPACETRDMAGGDERPFERPRRPGRPFPADDGPAGVVPGPALVELTCEDGRLLSGSAGGQPVRLDLTLAHVGAAAGTVAGQPVSASWENGDNYVVYPDVPAYLSGEFGGQPVELHGTFHLAPGYFFQLGRIVGHVGGEALEATAEPVSGGLGGRAVAVDGTLGATEFTLYATIDGSLSRGRLRGTVAGEPVRIDAERDQPPGRAGTRLAGRYLGPPALLALAVGAFLYFI